MLSKTHYANGQKVYELGEGRLTYFYKSGKLKAEGPFADGMMQGEWRFYDESGRLLQTGNLKDNLKDGLWIRYAGDGTEEYNEKFEAGRKVKK